MFLLVAACAAAQPAAQVAGKAKCVGGTLASPGPGVEGTVSTANHEGFVFTTKTSTLIIPYDRINLIEYGQEVGRRIVLAFLVSPAFLLMKARSHYLTLGFTDETGQQQALVLRVDKHLIRPALSALEARTGHSVQYTDQDARKARKG